MFLIKWLVIPVGLAAIGFFLVGPLLGRSAEPLEKTEAPSPQVVEDDTHRPKITGDPQVEVSARPVTRRRNPRRAPRTRTEPAPPSAPEVPSPDEEPPRSNPDGG